MEVLLYLQSDLGLSAFLATRKQHFGNWISSCSAVGREAATLLGPLERIDPSHRSLLKKYFWFITLTAMIEYGK
jgi:hypothetical protein